MTITFMVGLAKVLNKIIALIRICVNLEPCFWAINGFFGVVLTNINPLVVEDGPFRQYGIDETHKRDVKSREKFVKVEKSPRLRRVN
jgi:hypothetical protein